MVVHFEVNNGYIRQVKETEDGLECKLCRKKNGKIVPENDFFYDYNIPKTYMESTKIKPLKDLNEQMIRDVLSAYIEHIDGLLDSCDRYAALYRNNEHIGTFKGYAGQVLKKYVMDNKEEYPEARVGVTGSGYYWLVGIDCNIKGLNKYKDLCAIPVVKGIEIEKF